jgi:drug/metabolite transporter (DMT)-like permease
MLPWLLRHDPLRLAGIGWGRATVLTLLAGPLFILLGTGGYAYAPLAHGAVIQPSTIALASMLVAAVLLGERITRARLVGIALIVTGLALIASHAGAMGGGMVWIGDLMFAAAGLCWTGFTILIKRWELEPLAVTAVVSVLSALLVVPMMLVAGDTGRLAALPTGALLAQLTVQGLASGVVAVIAFGIAVRRLGAGRAGLFPAIVPAMTLGLASLWSSTLPQPSEIAGAALASLGLLVAVGLHRPAALSTAAKG